MTRTLSLLLLALGVVTLAALWSGGSAWMEARRDAPAHAARADALLAQGAGPAALGPGRFEQLLAIQDPGFYTHTGVDLRSPGAGITTMTQSLAKRLAFDEFQQGWPKIRQTGYAMGLETRLSKDQIAALWLATAEMGRWGQGWTTGFFEASQTAFARAPADLTEAEFLSLVTVLIAPATLIGPGTEDAHAIRHARVTRRVSGDCQPTSPMDVWLEGCA
ncbi:MAG: transglycosylase domain-containing protein [Pseudomonadota bacterium]